LLASPPTKGDIVEEWLYFFYTRCRGSWEKSGFISFSLDIGECGDKESSSVNISIHKMRQMGAISLAFVRPSFINGRMSE